MKPEQFNPYQFKAGDSVILDKGYINSSEVEIVKFHTELQIRCTVKDKDGHQWNTSTLRLSPII